MIGNIETNQIFELKNTVHFKGKLTQQETIEINNKIEKLLADNIAEKTGNAASVTNNIFVENGQQVMDIDLFIPVNKALELNGEFDFIKELRIENALKVQIVGNPMQLNPAMENIMNYVKENNLIPNTPPLVVTVKAATTPLEIEEMITEIYMGIEK